MEYNNVTNFKCPIENMFSDYSPELTKKEKKLDKPNDTTKVG